MRRQGTDLSFWVNLVMIHDPEVFDWAGLVARHCNRENDTELPVEEGRAADTGMSARRFYPSLSEYMV